MAIQLNTFVKGKVGNLVMYQLGDKYVTRSRPATVHKTKNMQTCSSNFGIVSKAGKLLRQAIAPILPNVTDTNMQRRFSGSIYKWLGKQTVSELLPQQNIPVLEAFNFNERTSFYERFKPKLQINISSDGKVIINIPAFVPTLQIASPAHTVSVEICLAAVACHLGTSTPVTSQIFKKQVLYNEVLIAAETIEMNLGSPQQKLVLVVASLNYILADGSVEKRTEFMPASVVRADYW